MKGVVKIPYMGDENDFDDFEVFLFVCPRSLLFLTAFPPLSLSLSFCTFQFEVSVEGKGIKAKSIVHQECKKVLKKAVKEFMEFMNTSAFFLSLLAFFSPTCSLLSFPPRVDRGTHQKRFPKRSEELHPQK